jgi:hypothetical protein
MERRGEIARIRATMPAEARSQPRYAPDNDALWMAYFQRCHAEQIALTNGAPAVSGGRNNSNGRRLWWGVPGHTLSAVLEHIEGGNEPPLEYLAPTAFSRRRSGGSGPWLPRRMAEASSSSTGATPPLVAVKAEPQETPERQRSRGGGFVIRECGRRQPSPPPPLPAPLPLASSG